MESASPEHQSEQPPGHLANLIGMLIAMITLTLPLYAVSNFNTAGQAPQTPSSLQTAPIYVRAQE